jgi:hypothetical protein
MKRNFLLYGLIFSVLINIFQYVNSSKILENQEDRIKKTKQTLDKATKENLVLKEANYFSLEQNDNAQEYYYPKDLDSIKSKVSEDLMATNNVKGNNVLIPYESVTGGKYLLNSHKFLNHRWIIANYSDGKGWGEVLIKYFHNTDKPTDFETVDAVFYQNTIQ